MTRDATHEDLRAGRTGSTTPGGLTGPYCGAWQTLEATDRVMVEVRLYAAGGLTLRESGCGAPSDTFRLSGTAVDALRTIFHDHAPLPTSTPLEACQALGDTLRAAGVDVQAMRAPERGVPLEEMATILSASGWLVIEAAEVPPLTPAHLRYMAKLLRQSGCTIEEPMVWRGTEALICQSDVPVPEADTAPPQDLTLLQAAAQYWFATHGEAWAAHERQHVAALLTNKRWAHALAYDVHKADLARDPELAPWFPPGKG